MKAIEELKDEIGDHCKHIDTFLYFQLEITIINHNLDRLAEKLTEKFEQIDERFKKIEEAIADANRLDFGSFVLNIALSFSTGFIASAIATTIVSQIAKKGIGLLKNHSLDSLVIPPNGKFAGSGYVYSPKSGEFKIIENAVEGQINKLVEANNAIINHLTADASLTTDLIANFFGALASGSADVIKKKINKEKGELIKSINKGELKTSLGKPVGVLSDWFIDFTHIKTFLQIQNRQWSGIKELANKSDNLFLLTLIKEITSAVDGNTAYLQAYSDYVAKFIDRYVDYGILIGMDLGRVTYHTKFITIETERTVERWGIFKLKTLSQGIEALIDLKWLGTKEYVNHVFNTWGRNVREFLVRNQSIKPSKHKGESLVLNIECVLCRLSNKKYAIALKMKYFYTENKLTALAFDENFIDPNDSELKQLDLPLIKYWIISYYPEYDPSNVSALSDNVMLNLLMKRTEELVGELPFIDLNHPNYYKSPLKAAGGFIYDEILNK